jgi:hypothetical protein
MKRALLSMALFVAVLHPDTFCQDSSRVEVYLLTCGPGTETYSIYGHSALRIVIPEKNSDLVYNWGVFDFNTPNFVLKFAKGRLDYMLGVYSYASFLREYESEKRWIVSQKVILERDETGKLFSLISENMKPENIKYRYDFFYDNCSTRIRDLFEKIFSTDLLYPPEEQKKDQQTFRDLIGHYQKGYPWLNVGIDLLIGSPADKKASLRQEMFLPLYLKDGLTALTVRRDGKISALLRNPEVVINYPTPQMKDKLLKSPLIVFSILLIVIVIMSALLKKPSKNRVLDIFLFAIFSVLAALMIFFNFMTDHQQTRWNLNIIWLNPFIFLCLASFIANKDWQIFFRITFFLALAFLALVAILPQHINDGLFPLVIILIIRSSVRSGFSWNPLNLSHLT